MQQRAIRRELWIRATLDDVDGINLGIVTVTDREQVLVSEKSLDALFKHKTGLSRFDESDTWFINYPIMLELLQAQGYILHDTKPAKAANDDL